MGTSGHIAHKGAVASSLEEMIYPFFSSVSSFV
jgi:hypothetical protein